MNNHYNIQVYSKISGRLTPKEYEQYMQVYSKIKGYKTIVTPYSNDWGIDVIAIKKKEK